MRLFWLIFVPAAAYQVLAIIAELRHAALRIRETRRTRTFRPGVSVLKPLRGSDPTMYEAFVSQARQNYPEFEILFGVGSMEDSAVAVVRRLQVAFPDADIRLIAGSSDAANRKVGVLDNLARHAKHSIWVVNDSDIEVGPDYLESVVAPLADPAIGVVTCPYRPDPQSAATTWEAVGVATDFIPSTLTAPLAGVREFGLGSTLAFRGSDFREAGGFPAIADYLADDYHLARAITGLGKRVLLSPYIVGTSLGDTDWRGVWHHQLRWSRTIRLSRSDGFAGIPITHTGVWALLACLLGAWPVALGLLILRLGSALLSAGLVLRSPRIAALSWLAPVWDFYALAIWLTSYRSNDVRWRDRSLTIDPDGKIEQKAKEPMLV
ncbi:MAG: bacteriohopanetetrol glucosamine biosynthesis glycosyltransferase HpnI [Bryobacteraceae bacterium]